MGDTGFSATVKGISLFDFIQLIVMTKKTKMIEINSDAERGIIEIKGGKIVFAVSSTGRKGEEAFYEVMCWENGSFKEIKTDKVVKENIESDKGILNSAKEIFDNLKELDQLGTNWAKSIGVIQSGGLITAKGRVLAQYAKKGYSFSDYAAIFKDQVKVVEKLLKMEKHRDFKDLVLKIDSHYVILQEITNQVFIGGVLNGSGGDLGVVRMEIEKIVPKIVELLPEYYK